MENFDINKFEIGKNYVLEASAGTGKTYSITIIVKKLVENGISLEEILIVTYTEKAAGELKEKIRKELPDANMSSAHIGTIHSFCKDILTEFAISAEQPLNLKVIDEKEVENFIEEYIREGDILNEIIKYMKNGTFDTANLIKRFKDAIDKYYLDLNGKCDETVISISKSYNEENKKLEYEDIVAVKYLDDLYIKWHKHKTLNKLQTFNDMIRNVRENVLHNEEFCLKLKKKFRYAIIDEFQDTNQKQFDIFKKVFMDEGHNIIVVGDPKQSIYAFQGADIDVYYEAVKQIGVENHYILGKNYRSTVPMVETCNKLFKYYNFDRTVFNDSKPLGDDEKDEVPAAFYNGKESKAFWVASKGEDHPAINSEEFADIAVQQIIDCCSYVDEKTKLQVQSDIKKPETKRNVSFKDFAILARTRSEMSDIVNSLKKAGIPFIKYKDNDLFLGRECAHWIPLLEAINAVDFTGNNRNKFKKALFTNFFGYELSEITNPKFDSDDSEEMELLLKWKMMAREEKWENLFDDIIVNSKLLTKMNSLREKQSLAKFKQISDYCIDYLSEGNSLTDLIRTLKRNNKNDVDGDGESAIIKKNTDFDSVSIMTIHASKGLEFPVVIVTGGFKQYRNRNAAFISKEDKRYLTFSKPKNDKDKAIAEFKRLFYVAYTRAKYVLILPYYDKYTDDFLKVSLENLMKDYINELSVITNRPLSNPKAKVQEILSKNKDCAKEAKDENSQNDNLKKIINNEYKQSSYKHSYSSLSHFAHNDESEIVTESGAVVETDCVLEGLSKYDRKGIQIECEYDIDKQMTLPDDFPKGNIIGTALHEIFELIDYTDYEKNIESVIKQCFKNQALPLKDQWLQPIKTLVENVLSAKLPSVKNDGFIQLKDISNANKNTEAEFNFNKENEYLRNYFNGFIDLIIRVGDYYAVVDWKTDSLNDRFTSYVDSTQLKKHVDEMYSIQRTLYAYCLIKWLKLNLNKKEDQIFKDHFGGVYYVFLRGCISNTSNGIYCHSWNSYQDLEESFNEIMKDLK